MLITRPLLAVAAKDLTQVKYPVLATPKLDGIRCLKLGGKTKTRTFKEIPNVHIRTMLEKILPDGIDGEIMIPGEPFNAVQSKVMSFDGEPVFHYHAFDLVLGDLNRPYVDRVKDLKVWSIDHPSQIVTALVPVIIRTVDQLLEYEAECLTKGYEGVMIRNPEGKYKCGRSTLNEGILLKIKQFEDAEAVVIGYEEKMHNTNEKVTSELGLSKRSSKKEGLVGAGTLGTILVRDIKTGVEFGVGSGFDDKNRKQIWENQDKYMGQHLTYKFQPFGQKEDVPRFPVFKGFRSVLDI
jgi:DNA ligase-1